MDPPCTAHQFMGSKMLGTIVLASDWYIQGMGNVRMNVLLGTLHPQVKLIGFVPQAEGEKERGGSPGLQHSAVSPHPGYHCHPF